MRRAVLLVLLVPFPILAQPPGTIVRETWETVSLEGARAGVVHSYVRELPPGGKVRRIHVQEMKLSLKRGTAAVELRQEHGFEEDGDGKVVGVFLRQFQGRKLALEVIGSVDPKSPDRLDMVKDGQQAYHVRWTDEAWRPGDLDNPPAKPRWQAGDKGTVRLFDPTYSAIITYAATAGEGEQLTLGNKRVSVTPLNLVPEPLVGGNRRVTLPAIRWWLDAEGHVLRREVDMPGLGMLTLTRSDRQGGGPVPAVVNVLERGLIPLQKTVPHPYTTTAARLRLTLKDIPDAATALVSDEHQTVRALGPGVLSVVVHPVGDQFRKEPAPGTTQLTEYLAPSPLLDIEERDFRALVGRLPAGPRDPWQRALARATWVRHNLRVDNAASFQPVSRIAKELRGDCRQAALLTTALCRADRLPARTAIGLVYIERNRKPYLGFHMWTEVYVAGAWRGLDGTPGIGSVGALHLKVTDASWAKETTLIPLQPALRLVGKMNAEVVEIVE